MTRTSVTVFGLLVFATGCGQGDRTPVPLVDCTQDDGYDFKPISYFAGGDSGWFMYADATPGGIPNIVPCVDAGVPEGCGSNVPIPDDLPPRCEDTGYIKLESSGHNFWGAGFGDWQHNQPTGRADGHEYEGISFWARSPANAEKTFRFNVDDGRTIILTPDAPDAGLLPPATDMDQDLDGDGYVGPGDIARGTSCRLPPPQELGEANCYSGGVDAPPTSGTRVPSPNECGNPFHVNITTHVQWRFFTIPWKDLVQWPCPNRLDGGIDRADIAKLEIRLEQGMHYEIWLDNIAFYRRL